MQGTIEILDKEMTKYKVYISIDKMNYFWIIIDNMLRPVKVIWNPTEDDLKDTVLSKYYNKTNICIRCREENNITEKSVLYAGNAFRDTDKNGKKIEEWVCKIHGLRHYNRYDPDSNTNIKKTVADRRTGNLRHEKHIIGDYCEELTKEWLGVKRLNIEYDKYSQLSLDHSPIPKGVSIIIGGKLVDLSGKVPSTKGRRYDSKYKRWPLTFMDEEFDILICYCISEDGKYIERIYIFHKKETINVTMINIHKGHSKYERCKVEDEKEINKVNDIWYKIINKSK